MLVVVTQDLHERLQTASSRATLAGGCLSASAPCGRIWTGRGYPLKPSTPSRKKTRNFPRTPAGAETRIEINGENSLGEHTTKKCLEEQLNRNPDQRSSSSSSWWCQQSKPRHAWWSASKHWMCTSTPASNWTLAASSSFFSFCSDRARAVRKESDTPANTGKPRVREAVPCGAPHGAVTPLRPNNLRQRCRAAFPEEVSSVPVGRRASRAPPPLSAPPPQDSGAVPCGGGPSPAPWLPSVAHDGTMLGAGDRSAASQRQRVQPWPTAGVPDKLRHRGRPP